MTRNFNPESECKACFSRSRRARHPDGYNIGINVGRWAGQSIPHLHIHVIPRYRGDVENPKGGVRGVIPHNKLYTFTPD